ncbi:MAG TPA: DUF1570 domain-containing protein [Planctomycetota bacterium]
MRCTVLSLLLVVRLSAAAAGQDPAADFESGLQAAREWMDKGRWDRAYQDLTGLVAAHPAADYVLRRRVEIVEDVRRCAFWMEHEPPKLASLISGEVVRYDAETGVVQLRYTHGRLDDFVVYPLLGGVRILVHPLTFVGPCSIEVRSRRYPQIRWAGGADHEDFARSPLLFAGMRPDQEEGYAVVFGLEEERVGKRVYRVPARLLRFDGDDSEVLDELDPTPAEAREPYSLKVTVSAAQIKAYYGRKAILSGNKPRDFYGRMGLANVDDADLEEIVIRGRANSAWFRGLADAAMQGELAAFERAFRADAHLPGWLAAGPEPASARPASDPTYGWPVKIEGGDYAWLVRLRFTQERRGWEVALRMLDKETPESLPDDLRAWLRALGNFHLGRAEAARAAAEPLWKSRPGFVTARALEPLLLAHLESAARGLVAARALVEEFPDAPSAYQAHAQLLLEAGMPEAAQGVLENAESHGVRAPVLEQLAELLAKALRGPAWPRVHEHESRHYRIASDLDLAVCKTAGALLEKAYRDFSKRLHEPPDIEDRKFPVYVFSGEEGYRAYIAGAIGAHPLNTAGLYSPVLKQTLVWNLPFRDQMLATLRHEGFHQYLDRVVQDAPVWFNEGMAEYFENAGETRVGWREGRINRSRYLTLVRRDFAIVPLARFLHMEAAEYYGGDTDLHYAQAWALVHFLRNGGAAPAERNDALFARLLAGERAAAAVAAVFPATDLAILEAAFLEHVRRLAAR